MSAISAIFRAACRTEFSTANSPCPAKIPLRKNPENGFSFFFFCLSLVRKQSLAGEIRFQHAFLPYQAAVHSVKSFNLFRQTYRVLPPSVFPKAVTGKWKECQDK